MLTFSFVYMVSCYDTKRYACRESKTSFIIKSFFTKHHENLNLYSLYDLTITYWKTLTYKIRNMPFEVCYKR